MPLKDSQTPISVSELVQLVAPVYDRFHESGISKERGIEIHQSAQTKLKKISEIQTEIDLDYDIYHRGHHFFLRGRIDGLIENGQQTTIIEIKGVAKKAGSLRYAHKLQLLIYLAIASAHVSRQVRGELQYWTIAKEVRTVCIQASREALEYTLIQCLDFYIAFQNLKHSMLKNFKGMKDSPFPFKEFRPGQRETMIEVFGAIHKGGEYILEAPTGQGKTISVVWPAIKHAQVQSKQLVICLPTKQLRQHYFKTLRSWIPDLQILEYCSQEDLGDSHSKILRPMDLEILEELRVIERRAPSGLVQEYAVKVFPVVLCDHNFLVDPIIEFPVNDAIVIVDEGHGLVGRIENALSAHFNYRQVSAWSNQLGPRDGKRLIRAIKRVESNLTKKKIPKISTTLRDLSFQVPKLTIWLQRLSFLLEHPIRVERSQSTEVHCPDLHIWRESVDLHSLIVLSATFGNLPTFHRMILPNSMILKNHGRSNTGTQEFRYINNLNTKYKNRTEMLPQIALEVTSLFKTSPCNTLVFCSSKTVLAEIYQRLLEILEADQVLSELTDLEHMEKQLKNDSPLIALCLFGGRFNEGVEFPGKSVERIILVGPPLVPPKDTEYIWGESSKNGQEELYTLIKLKQAIGRANRGPQDHVEIVAIDPRLKAFLPSKQQSASQFPFPC